MGMPFIETAPKTKFKLSWDAVNSGVEVLAHMLKPLKPHLIVGVSRGGLIPAVMLSHKLNCHVETISASAYSGTRRTLEKPITIEGWKPEYDRTNTIVVDDIFDTGATVDAIRYKQDNTYFHNFYFASLVSKRPEANNRNIYFMRVPQHMWVQFPWEQDES